MNRIPTEGLKLTPPVVGGLILRGLNEQNPDRGIETLRALRASCQAAWLE